MRTQHSFAILAIAAGATLGACNWTEFDNLADETWVDSTEKPGVDSSDYGVAIQRGNRTGTTDGRLVVIGATQATYSELVYDVNGNASLPSTTLELNSQYGIGNLDPQPILIADPTTDNSALVVNAGGSSILVLEGTNGAVSQHQLFVSPSTVEAAVYMVAPQIGNPGQAQPIQPLVASGELVLGTFYGTVPNPQPKCKLTAATVAILPRALGVVRNGMFDDVVAWGADGKLYRYPSSVFNGCATMQEFSPLPAPANTGFMPGRGSQILAIDGTRILLQGHHDSDDVSFLQVYDAATLTAIGGPVSIAKQRTAAILTSNGTKYAIVGYPTEVVDGEIAGQVRVFRIGATGLETSPVATFNDAQPEDRQSFGRSVAAMPYHGQEVIAVAADNEIFVYFRAKLSDGTMLYDETRQGR